MIETVFGCGKSPSLTTAVASRSGGSYESKPRYFSHGRWGHAEVMLSARRILLSLAGNWLISIRAAAQHNIAGSLTQTDESGDEQKGVLF